MKKGFTLIELLSVIVVLAIISVIAIPTLIGVVNKVKLQSLRSSAYGLIEAGTLYNAQYANSNNARFDIMNNVITTTEENKIKYKGSVKQGTVIISTKGKVSVCVTDGKNSAYKNYNDTEVTLVSKKTCSVPANTAVIYLDGEATIDANDAKAILDKLDEMKTEINDLKSRPTSGFPTLDYANPLFTFSGTLTYTATKDCYMDGQLTGNGNTLYIDNTIIAQSRIDGGHDYASGYDQPVILRKIHAGQVVRVSSAAPNLHIFEEK